jgi:hypothetical protein
MMVRLVDGVQGPTMHDPEVQLDLAWALIADAGEEALRTPGLLASDRADLLRVHRAACGAARRSLLRSLELRPAKDEV